MFTQESKKPLLVGEFGVDSYNDPCGWPQNSGMSPCYNDPYDPTSGAVSMVVRNFKAVRDASLPCRAARWHDPGTVGSGTGEGADKHRARLSSAVS